MRIVCVRTVNMG